MSHNYSKYSKESLLELIDAENLRIEAAKMKIEAYELFLEEPAEPVVLSAEEWVDRQPFRSIEDENGTVKLFRSKRLFTFDQMVDACETFKQNGRLERDLELRGLVEHSREVGSKQITDSFLNEILDNLKPLNKD